MTPVRGRRGRASSGEDGERGSTTVELAIGMTVVAVGVGLVLDVAGAASTRADLCHAVRSVAREAAVGGDHDAVARALVPGGGHVTVARSGRWVTVTGEAPAGTITARWGSRASCRLMAPVEQVVP